MPSVDLNLLPALDALLAERSVTGAARRTGLSVSAMSRTLARLRRSTGDPLLIQAGRALVLTPYAMELGERLPALTREAQAALAPARHALDLARLERTFTIRAGEGFIELVSAILLRRLAQTAPRVCLRFAPKPDWNVEPLRQGALDLEIGVLNTSAPELRARALFRDRYVGVCRSGHPLTALSHIGPEQFLAHGHVLVSRSGAIENAADGALAALGGVRRIQIIVPAYTNALQIVRQSDLLAVVPHSCVDNGFVPGYGTRNGVQWFELPLAVPAFNVCAIWHPRLDRDPAQRWLRGELLALCQETLPQT
ncbi:LysR substrate-binding domain-containing protein [Chitinasiproducens palmae]|uniref:DNA-binding transcriptional regulator, LysR family n=1 Tax=Chitinasiproducens palmae TaxID=1770053 RepID=A0A1H2PL23_9BURK|nr:LysR substrate-binding domain-containing protein [Chitinasiproducens palmae]SDV47065.1 DNA-binding transcriptional regulator, LysR family [Chitinasiproducens palmae]